MESVLKIEDVKAVAPAPDGSAVVIKATADHGDARSELEIAITSELAASVAITLLATTAKARAERDGLEPALEVLAAAVVQSGDAEKAGCNCFSPRVLCSRSRWAWTSQSAAARSGRRLGCAPRQPGTLAS